MNRQEWCAVGIIVAYSRSDGVATNYETAWVTVALQHLSLLFNLCCPGWHVLPLLSGVSP